MSCPPGFRLELNPELEKHPLPKPPEYLKHQVYDKAEVFEKIDNHAIEISKREFPTFTHLMWNLVFRHKMSDIERARVIFRWITSKNMQRITFDSAPPNSPEELLLSFKGNKTSFARIYEIMCTYGGLHCVAISGYAKGVDYFPGDRFQGLPANHSWNAVYLKGSWQLVDAQWATRYLSSGMNLHDNVVYEYDDFYFLMEPQQAVYSHFPEDCRWQLLAKQLTLTQFESLPLTKSQFFKCAMDFRGEHHGVVQVLDGCIRMTLGFWRPGAFTYKLQHLVGSARSAQPALLPVRSSELTDSFEMTIHDTAGEQERLLLKDFVLQETTEDALNFFVRLPTRGTFFLTIYAQDLSNVVMARNGTFRAACEYKLVFAEGEACCEPYPACDDMNWGPSWLHTRHYGLEMAHPSGVISLPPGRVTPTGEHVEPGHLELRCTRHRPDVQLFTKLKRNYVPDEVLEQFQRIHLTDGEAIFELNLPEPGEYGFDIYANEPDDGRAFTHVCQYLVHYEAPQGWHPQNAADAWETTVAGEVKPNNSAAPRVVSTAEVTLSPMVRKSPQRESLIRLRQMPAYGTEAPSIGQLPQPYLEPEIASVQRQSMINDTNRRPARVFPPVQHDNNTEYSDQVEFRYAPTTWSDTESLDRGMNAMRINGAPTTNGRGHPDSERSDRYSPFSGDNRRPSQQYNRIGVTNQPAVVGKTFSSTTATIPPLSYATWVPGPLQKEPPKEFVPQLLDPEPAYQKPDPEAIPGRTPVYAMQEDDAFKAFQKVDEHAMAVSYQEQNSFNQLIWQLIYARNITSDLERVRAIFLWLCTKDLHQMNFDNVTPGSPEEILMGIRTGKSTYAQIFQTLCRYANLHCKLLLGYAKGADYSPGMRFTGAAVGQHSWNAVLVDGTWHLIDCHWAARRLIVKRASVENVRYILDTFYFLTNPSQLIYTHFPHDKDWQLLHHPITLEEFESLPLVKSAFFKYNLSLVSHRTAVILFNEPEVRVVIGYPREAANTFLFTIGLCFDDSESGENYQNTPLMRYARQEVISKECCVAFYIRPPRPGAYRLLIYTKKRDGSGMDGVYQPEDLGSPGSGEKSLYGAVCEYRLMARVSSNACLPPFPPCQTGNYGPTELFQRFNVVPVGSDSGGAFIRAQEGIAEVRFAMGGGSQHPLPRMMAKLRCSLLSEEALDNCILLRVLKSGTEAVITVFLPDAGEFGLEIYACDPERDGSSYYAIWQYLIITEMASPIRGVPNLPLGYLGPAARFYELGLQVVSHPDPLIKADAAEIRIQFAYQPQRPLKMMAQLIFSSNNTSEDYSQMVLQQMRMGQVFFIVRIPRLGFFKLQIYALPESDRDDSLPGVYNYLIESTKATHRLRGQLMPFPQQFAHWRRSGCYLDSPTEGILGIGENGRLMNNPPPEINFSLAVPSAHAVAVVVDEDWTYLEARGDRWEGIVNMRPHWGRQSRLSVCASYSPEPDANFSTLLEYTLAH
ncbi:unnamed protein product [Hymenolepis diminuta]|uniref:Transglutaminase-like domain-containing protein n=1 Tax=Hymenolepis diminuta TaxID=6216 RepID=A0A564YPJ4_HYMDI|nr:unnamed protein product [Hymenolepis diminuta]